MIPPKQFQVHPKYDSMGQVLLDKMAICIFLFSDDGVDIKRSF